MGSISAQETHLDSGDDSFLILPSKHKRRKVSAVRDFPRGCVPKAPQIKLLRTLEVHDRPKDGVASKDADVNKEKIRGFCEADGKGLSEDSFEGQGHDVSICANWAELEASRNEESQKLPGGNPDTLQEIQTVKGRSLWKDQNQDPSGEEVMLDIPIALADFRVVDRAEPSDVFKNKKTVGLSVQQLLLPHYPIPLAMVWQKPKYPPRKRGSAVRDFPAGCGHDVLTLIQNEVKYVVYGETDVQMHEGILNPDDRKLDGNNAFEDEIQGIVSGRSGDTLGEKIDIDEAAAAARMIVQEILFQNKEPHNSFGNNKHDRCVNVVEQLGSDGGQDGRNIETASDGLDSNTSFGPSNSNTELQGEVVAGTGSKKRVAVQGLMSAASCPWREGKGSVNSSPSGITAKGTQRRKNSTDTQDKPKLSLNKRKKNSEKFAERSMMMVSYCKETEMEMGTKMYESCTPLAVRYNEEYSENDEPNGFLPRTCELDCTLSPYVACTSNQRSARSTVRKTLRLFQAIVRQLLQGEETKSKEKGKAGKKINILAANIMRDSGKYINTEKVIGVVPGVEVGDVFSYRTELAIIGVHAPLQSGIDTIRQGKRYLAISVVASGGYDNDIDCSDKLIYTGQGGNPAGPDKQPEDQKLERGNLALKNCIDEKTPVRVIRGFKEAKSAANADARPKMIATYTYDGLYTVERYWQDLGSHGKLVYKFELRRIPGQHGLAWKEVKQAKKFKGRQGRCVDDISGGNEKVPICAFNTVDGEQPPSFTYTTSMIYPDWCRPIPCKGCDCKHGCSDSERCACAVKNGGEIPYNLSGAIVKAKPLVYECGPSCKCPPSCPNRVSQHGVKLPLEIFKTESRGWGVRCLSYIPSGSFICEYIGELLDDQEAEQRVDRDEYLFEIGRNYYDDFTLTDGLSAVMPDKTLSASDVVENVGFTVDAAKFGNIGRFINHSCSPNLYAQNVVYKHEDTRIPHVMLFAMENIPPLEELTYHYNYNIDQVFDAEGKIKRKDCYCGAAECTGRMY